MCGFIVPRVRQPLYWLPFEQGHEGTGHRHLLSRAHDGLDEVVRDTARKEGTRGFFKGMMYPLLTAGAINSIFFGVYGVTLAQLEV